ncbi:MAG: hypothetical protein M3O09_13985 [Acidobacteriota bacterium]|nr:hypothetical protein [Acidobacteriota bacterium]
MATFRLVVVALIAQSILFGASMAAPQAEQAGPPSVATQQLQKDRKDKKTQRHHQKEADRQDAKNKKTALEQAPKSQKLPDSLKRPRNKPRPAPSADEEPQKTVVQQGSTPDPNAQISPRLAPAQASRKILTTAELLASTDDNLKKVSGSQLSTSQQEMVNQIKSYVQQSKSAEDAGDLQLSQNLAFKAYLLSDELTHH